MAFSELIKSFDKLRDYMRDFFIYGYKTRSDFSKKSARTYDNERRRVESYLADYMRFGYGKNGKRFFISIDSARISQNPLYRAYRAKSFTDNDILLHFFLLDLLEDLPTVSAKQAADEISLRYGELFDVQTVRGKLREYAGAGLLYALRQGKTVLYKKSACSVEDLFPHKEEARDFLAFFGECSPFAVVGSYLSERVGLPNTRLRFKHHFLMHTLEDTVLLRLTEAMRQQREVEITNFSNKSGLQTVAAGFPAAILASTQTGRRYLVLYGSRSKRFHSFRLDCLKSVRMLGVSPQAGRLMQEGGNCIAHSWGASISPHRRTEHFSMTIRVDEQKEGYVLERLLREGRGGSVERVAQNEYRFCIDVADSGELMGWVKTFTGRLLAVEGDNQGVVARFFRDISRMEKLYQEEGE